MKQGAALWCLLLLVLAGCAAPAPRQAEAPTPIPYVAPFEGTFRFCRGIPQMDPVEGEQTPAGDDTGFNLTLLDAQQLRSGDIRLDLLVETPVFNVTNMSADLYVGRGLSKDTQPRLSKLNPGVLLPFSMVLPRSSTGNDHGAVMVWGNMSVQRPDDEFRGAEVLFFMRTTGDHLDLALAPFPSTEWPGAIDPCA